MNYIGSKVSLLDEIHAVLEEGGVPESGIALDVFAGTGAVAQAFKLRGHPVIANDWQWYSFATTTAFIGFNSLPELPGLRQSSAWPTIERKAAAADPLPLYSVRDRGMADGDEASVKVLQYLNELEGCEGTFTREYCEGGAAGRLYYSRENGMRIQAVRDTVEKWWCAGWVSEREKLWLIACLVEAADRVANTASVYGAYLKRVKATARKPLKLIVLNPTPSAIPAHQHQITCGDAETVVRGLPGPMQLAYFDPPYNARQYSSNYHIIETIARWDLGEFEPRGVTGLRPADAQRSQYCMRRTAPAAFRRLLEATQAEYFLFSYNNEGLLSGAQLRSLFESLCDPVVIREVAGFKRFRADTDRPGRVYAGDVTVEYLILGRRRAAEHRQSIAVGEHAWAMQPNTVAGVLREPVSSSG